MTEIFNKLARDIAEKYDDFIFEQFEKYGFSKDDIHKAILEDRLRINKHDDYEDFSIDGVFYFSIFKKYDCDKILLHVVDLKGGNK